MRQAVRDQARIALDDPAHVRIELPRRVAQDRGERPLRERTGREGDARAVLELLADVEPEVSGRVVREDPPEPPPGHEPPFRETADGEHGHGGGRGGVEVGDGVEVLAGEDEFAVDLVGDDG